MAEMPKIAPIPAVPAGDVPIVVAATAIPVSGARTAMLQPGASFPPTVDAANRQGGCCSSKVDCTCCFSGKDFAMIDGQRFYPSFKGLDQMPPHVRKALPSAWSEIVQPYTDVIVAINGVYVCANKPISTAVFGGAPDPMKSVLYVMRVLAHAIQSRRAAGPGATVPFVVLRQTGVGEAAYLVVELPVDEMELGGASPECCGGGGDPLLAKAPLQELFTFVAYSPDTWKSVNKFVSVTSDAPTAAGVGLRKGDILLAINGQPVDGEPELAHKLMRDASASGGGVALVKRGPVRPETKPQFVKDSDGGGRWMVDEGGKPFKEDCNQAEVNSIGPSGWFSVTLVPLPPAEVSLEAAHYSVGGWPRVGLAVDRLTGRFAGAAGCWALECMRGQFKALSTEDDPSGDLLRFSGCKLYSDLWAVGGHNGGIIIPCLCFPFPICYTYTRERGGNRFNPHCSLLPCYGPWIVSFHGCCCTESGTFTDEDTFESACDCCGKMTRRK
jgi:hypothetical protein